MKTSINSLAAEHKDLARDLWQSLYHAPTQDDLVAAHVRFETAPLEVRSAILTTFIQRLGGKKHRATESNPFH